MTSSGCCQIDGVDINLNVDKTAKKTAIYLLLVKIFVFLPNVTILPLLSIFIDKSLFFGVRIFNFSNNESYIRVIIIDVTIEASVISLIDRKIVMATRSIDLKTDKRE